jgi:hypothetical protein
MLIYIPPRAQPSARTSAGDPSEFRLGGPNCYGGCSARLEDIFSFFFEFPVCVIYEN